MPEIHETTEKLEQLAVQLLDTVTEMILTLRGIESDQKVSELVKQPVAEPQIHSTPDEIRSYRVEPGHYKTEEGYEIKRANGNSWKFIAPDGSEHLPYPNKKSAMAGVQKHLSEHLVGA